MKPRIICFGAGGHASVVVDLLQLLEMRGDIDFVGMVASNTDGSVLGAPILGNDDGLAGIVGATGATHFIIGIGSVRGGEALRPRLFSLAQSAGLVPFSAIHPSAVVARSATVEAGATIMAGVTIQARARIDHNAIVNTHASIDHDTIVGPHGHVAPGVTCSGAVVIGQNAHVGVGAVIREGIVIGADATIGAGAVVVKDCPDGVTMIGVPARPVQSR